MKRLGFYLMVMVALLTAPQMNGKIVLPSVLGNNMVMQRKGKVNLWGWASPGSVVMIEPSWSEGKYKVKADANGKWITKIPTGDAGGPYTITISDNTDTLVLENVMLGEVWICSGQSNMEMPVQGYMHQSLKGAVDAILDAPHPSKMRFFTVERAVSDTAAIDCGGEWLEASPESVANFSACGYFFGRQLSDLLDVPIGLITSNWSGTSIEPWIDVTTYESIENIDRKTANDRSAIQSQQTPGYLFNGMINPITNYTAKGFIWYQGESNRGHADDYVKLLSNLIGSWREKWGDASMPFYMVQLAPFPYGNMGGVSLPLMVEAQCKVASQLPHVGIAATTDIGSPVCIHPTFKKEVGRRLAFLALQNDYGVKGLPLPAPTFKSMKIDGNKVTLDFNNVATHPNRWNANSFEVYTENKYLRPLGFEIAGDDRIFYPATGVFNDAQTTIEIYSDSVPNPVAVRYCFHNYMPEANVRTCLGQPLIPFRTDDWPIEK